MPILKWQIFNSLSCISMIHIKHRKIPIRALDKNFLSFWQKCDNIITFLSLVGRIANLWQNWNMSFCQKWQFHDFFTKNDNYVTKNSPQKLPKMEKLVKIEKIVKIGKNGKIVKIGKIIGKLSSSVFSTTHRWNMWLVIT